MNYWKLLIFLFVASPALADKDELMECRVMDDAEQRLACFDEYVDSRYLTVEQIKEEADPVAVTAISKNSSGRMTITLENGQVWRQNDSKTFRLSVGDAVFVRSKSFGSFVLSKESSSRSIRVKRVD